MMASPEKKSYLDKRDFEQGMKTDLHSTFDHRH